MKNLLDHFGYLNRGKYFSHVYIELRCTKGNKKG